MNLHDCFEYFGVKAPNPRWAWSGISDDQMKVAVALWEDAIRQEGNYWLYDDRDRRRRLSANGARARLEHLKIALANQSTVHVVKVLAKDTRASTRSIVPGKCYPVTSHTLHVTDLNEQNGTFRAEIVPANFELESR